MPEEITIYQDQTIHITNLRAVIDGKTYPIANITSVGTLQQNPNGILPMVLIFGGIAALLISVPTLLNARTWDNNYPALTFGILMLIPGIAILRNSKPTYILQLATAAGEVKAMQSTDRDHIAKLTEALNQAIIQRG